MAAPASFNTKSPTGPFKESSGGGVQVKFGGYSSRDSPVLGTHPSLELDVRWRFCSLTKRLNIN